MTIIKILINLKTGYYSLNQKQVLEPKKCLPIFSHTISQTFIFQFYQAYFMLSTA